MRRSLRLILVFTWLTFGTADAKYSYKPTVGDKFQYKISKNKGRNHQATFVYDIINKEPVFYYKWGFENPIWGTWTESNLKNSNIIKEIKDSSSVKQCNLVYLNADVYKQLKSGKNYKLTIQNEEIEFGNCKLIDYVLPIIGASLKSKVLSATSVNHKWIIQVLDNEKFPLITSLLGDVSWQLQRIVPFPMYPITQNIMGEPIESKKAELFKAYINESCAIIEANYKENFKAVNFKEFFCPTIGIRFSLKNDTIVSIHLLSKNNFSDGYQWHTYRGCVWGIFKLGDNQKAIENKIGKAESSDGTRNYYPNQKFYLVYNARGDLETVDYE